MDEDSERAARVAVAETRLSTVSGARVRDELMDLLGRAEAPAAVERMRELGLDRALHPALDAGSGAGRVRVAGRGRDRRGARDRRRSRRSCAGDADGSTRWVAGLQLEARRARRGGARRSRRAARSSRSCARASTTPSELRDLLGDEPPEALALALALGAPSEPILRWVTELRDVRLEISGADLLAAGVPEGPALGRALNETLTRKLDGLVRGRDQELRTALELARRS